jgi:glycosyltransferase involved in cell wall biosynthesis
MLISIIIPVYNRINSLKRAIESVLCQNEKNYELIIIDDGSNFDIKSSISHYLKNSKINYYKYAINKGVSYARNIGIKKAKGDYIALLDSDDLWLPFKLKIQVEVLKNNKNNHIIFTDEFWLKNGQLINKPIYTTVKYEEAYPYLLDKCRVSP